jgi:hypothetical protein
VKKGAEISGRSDLGSVRTAEQQEKEGRKKEKPFFLPEDQPHPSSLRYCVPR